MSDPRHGLVKWIRGWLSGEPHFIIGDRYLLRWYVLPRNRWINVYLHKFLHDDEDRALHDHPWWFISIMVKGGYDEIVRDRVITRNSPSIAFRRAEHAHRVRLHRAYDNHVIARPLPCWTLVITGRVVRDWGFHCPQGWRHWREFTAPENYGQTGKGCE
jgi:hypothetical protein